MKRYLLFGYDNYYPWGADQDYEDEFDSVSEIDNYIAETKYPHERYVFLDTQSGCWITWSRPEEGDE